MKIVLIRNFAPDGQQSMLRLADSLARGLAATDVDVEVIAPTLRWGRLAGAYRYDGVSKWLGYFDKYVVFPRTMRARLKALQDTGESVVLHVVDHGNAPYVPRYNTPSVVTCADLLAVRAARGEQSGVTVSRFAHLQQAAVERGLQRTDHVACISTHTREDLLRIKPDLAERSSVVLLALNHPYQVRPPEVCSDRIRNLSQRGGLRRADGATATFGSRAFILHVGSAHPRKNRATIVRVLAETHQKGWQGDLVLAGEAPEPAVVTLAAELGLLDRLWHADRPDNDELEALYNRSTALLFPSIAEGFGWPVIEAQACGCPVIASNTTSLPEVAGNAARLFDPRDATGMCGALLELLAPSHRNSLIAAGIAHAANFTEARMAARYRDIYLAVAKKAAS